MATQSPYPFLDDLLVKLQPPAWVVGELQHRLVLLLNHILQQEPEAQARLKRQQGKVLRVHWREFSLCVSASPAGLLELAPLLQAADLTLTLTETSAVALLRGASQGEKPPVHIEGDVQLAAEVNWLVDHVRWDIEEDLSRMVGDVPAHAVGQAARSLRGTLRQFVGSRAPGGLS